MNLLIFFALPIATIIVSIALQKILKCPWLVAAIIFAIFLIVTFVIDTLSFLVATIAYTIISFITALIVCFICRFLSRNRRNSEYNRGCNCDFCSNYSCERNRRDYRNDNNLLTISSNCSNGISNDLLTISSNTFNRNNNCGCNSCNNNGNNSDNNGVIARINVIPNENTNGRSGCVCGSYRRR